MSNWIEQMEEEFEEEVYETQGFRHYIRLDDQNRIIAGWSEVHRKADDMDILLTENGSYQFRLFPDGEENPDIYDEDGVPLYKWDGEKVMLRTPEEIKADKMNIDYSTSEPTIEERLAFVERFIASQISETDELLLASRILSLGPAQDIDGLQNNETDIPYGTVAYSNKTKHKYINIPKPMMRVAGVTPTKWQIIPRYLGGFPVWPETAGSMPVIKGDIWWNRERTHQYRYLGETDAECTDSPKDNSDKWELVS